MSKYLIIAYDKPRIDEEGNIQTVFLDKRVADHLTRAKFCKKELQERFKGKNIVVKQWYRGKGYQEIKM